MPLHVALSRSIGAFAAAAFTIATIRSGAQDCNENGLPDAWDLEPRIEFAAASSFDVGDAPRAVAVDRMNGDSRPDIVAAGGADGAVTLLLALGDGRFAAPRSFPAIPAPSAVALGDLDGDGDNDVVVSSPGVFPEPGAMALLWNEGDGLLSAAQALGSLSSPRAIACADLDGAMTIPPQMNIFFFDEPGGPGEWRIIKPGAVALYTNRGSDGFQKSVELPARAQPNAIASCDLDGDSDLDLAVTDSASGEVALWRNTGAGEFTPLATLSAGTQPEAIDAGDIDLDGDVDLAVADAARSRVMVFSNRSDGMFDPGVGLAVNGDPFGLQLVDLDRSGSLGIVVACRGSFDLWAIKNLTRPPRSTDCNGNAAPDECDITSGLSRDVDQNGLPDECGIRFRRGETNEDDVVDLSDAVTIFGYLFLGNPPGLACDQSADVDRSGRLDLSDGIALLAYLFLSAPAPPRPFTACGFDPHGGALTCESFPVCK